MQLIEVSVTGVRSAVITLRSPDAAMRIVLFPMAHLGTAEYYRSVETRLEHCDLVVAEGVGGRSAGMRSLTVVYRLPALSRRLKLAVQDIDYASLDVPVVNPDMTGREFGTGWRSVPLAQRLLVACLAPWAALSLALLGTRRTIGRHLAVDDLPTALNEQVRDKLPDLTRLVLDERDQLLADCLTSVFEARRHEDIDVAVVYGAGHMAAVARELSRRHGYRPRTADWLTVLDFLLTPDQWRIGPVIGGPMVHPSGTALNTRHPLAGRKSVEFSEIIGEPAAALPVSAGSQRDFWLGADARDGVPPHVAAEVSAADEKFEIISSGAAITLLAAKPPPRKPRGGPLRFALQASSLTMLVVYACVASGS